jgi:hypothetical protein
MPRLCQLALLAALIRVPTNLFLSPDFYFLPYFNSIFIAPKSNVTSLA